MYTYKTHPKCHGNIFSKQQHKIENIQYQHLLYCTTYALTKQDEVILTTGTYELL